MTPEDRVKSAIRKYLDDLKQSSGGQLFWDARQAGGFCYKKGIPDLWCVYKGVHYEIEVKAPGGHRTPLQEKFQTILQKAGCVYIVADCVEDVKNLIH